jgi:hypothetical protein
MQAWLLSRADQEGEERGRRARKLTGAEIGKPWKLTDWYAIPDPQLREIRRGMRVDASIGGESRSSNH